MKAPAASLPVGMTFVSSSGPWTCEAGEVADSGQEVTCLLDAGTAGLAVGATAPLLTLRVLLDPALEEGVLSNAAAADSPTVDPAPERAEDDHDVEVTELVDLVIVKSHDGPVRIGDPLTFSLQVRNEGPSVARDVQVVDVVPDALVAVDAMGEGWSCALDGQQVTCDLDEPLAPQTAARPITIEVEVTAAAYPTVDNTAQVSATTPESDEANNTSTDTVAVPAQVDLAIVKSHDGRFVVGQQGTFTLAVTNLGPTVDPGPITVVDVLPAGLVPLTATGDGWDCDVVADTVTCVRVAGLEGDQTSPIALGVRIDPAAAPGVVNEATVASDSEDLDPSNDRDDDEVVVVDELADGLTFRSSSGAGWVCEAVGQTVTCVYEDSLPVGSKTVLSLATDIDAPQGTVIGNRVEVSGGGEQDGDAEVLGEVITAVTEVEVGALAEVPDEDDELAATGADIRWLLAAGVLAAAAGLVLLRGRRERVAAR